MNQKIPKAIKILLHASKLEAITQIRFNIDFPDKHELLDKFGL